MENSVSIKVLKLSRDTSPRHVWLRAECSRNDCEWMLEGRNVSAEDLQIYADHHTIQAH